MATAAKKAGAAAPASTTPYEVTSPLNHDGELYAIGDEVELTDAQAAALLGLAIAPKSAAKVAG